MTNTRHHASQLINLGTKLGSHVLPVPSGVGEIECPTSLTDRPRRIAVFGSAAGRGHAYRIGRGVLRYIVDTWDIAEIVDIGAPLATLHLPNVSCPVRRTGYLRPEDVSHYLRDSVIGLVAYPSIHAAKSTVLAAYCAHGLASFLFDDTVGFATNHDDLIRGTHFLTQTDRLDNLNLYDLERIAVSASKWYSNHSVRRHADSVALALAAQ